MKKHGILNSEIAKVLADLGHTDKIAIVDCGMPIPKGVKKIDLSIKKGVPSLIEVIQVLNDNMVIESFELADEINDYNPQILKELKKYMLPIEFMSNSDLKIELNDVMAVIRTGEITPYGNVILNAGIDFSNIK